MKKFILLIMLIIGLSGCGKKIKYDEEYYTRIADTAVSFFRDKVYDKEEFNEPEVAALDNYLFTITHDNHIIDLTPFIDSKEHTDESNSEDVFTRGNTCYISYEDVKKSFDSFNQEASTDETHFLEIEPYYRGVCNKRYFTIYESALMPDYEVTKNDPRYDYVLLKNIKTKEDFRFYYRSTYDASGLEVVLTFDGKKISKISSNFVNIDGLIQPSE